MEIGEDPTIAQRTQTPQGPQKPQGPSRQQLNLPAQTALHVACDYEHFKVVELLLEKYSLAHPQSSHLYISTALWQAAAKGQMDIIKIFLSRGLCFTELRSDLKYHPLPVAAKEGQLEIVKFLLAANPESVGIYDPGTGNAALHFAAESGHFDIIEALLGAGADINAPSTPNHYTPLLCVLMLASRKKMSTHSKRRETVKF